MVNHRQTRICDAGIRLMRLMMCAVVALGSTVVRAKNLYNDWAQKNAVNLIKSVDSSRADLAEEQKTCISKPDNQFRMLVNKASKAKEAVYNNAWSGTRKDLEAVVRDAEHSYGFENAKHLGRNATMLVPATLDEMRKEIRLGNPNHWEASSYDGAHGSNANSDDNLVEMLLKKYNNGVSKFIIPEKRGNVLNKDRGREVVYDNVTGKITTNEKMGTWNFGSKNGFISTMRGPHRTKDMDPHATKADKANQFERDGDQYKYVGILYERDPNNPDKYYIIDGQTGLPMTPQQVAEMPTTLSDMWKDMGLVCVSNDAKDMIEPDECRDEAKCIDTAKLEELLKEGILFLKDLIAKEKRATNSQIDTHNKRVNRMVDELVNIIKQINSFNVSAEEKKRISEEALADVVLLNSQFISLCEQAKSMGLVNEATNGQKMEQIKNVQWELSEISRDAQRAKDSSAKAMVAPQRRTMTDEEAIRLLREDGSGIKAVADALKD